MPAALSSPRVPINLDPPSPANYTPLAARPAPPPDLYPEFATPPPPAPQFAQPEPPGQPPRRRPQPTTPSIIRPRGTAPLRFIPIPLPIPSFAPPRPVLNPNHPVLGNLSRGLNGFQDILSGLLPPGLNLADQAGRAAGEAFARRFFPNPRNGDRGRVTPAPVTPPPPIAAGGGLYKLVVRTTWDDPALNSAFGGTFYVQAWGPIYFLHPNNAGQRGPEPTAAGVTILAHGNSFYSSEGFQLPTDRSASPIWGNIGGGTSDVNQQVRFTYRLWPASEPDPGSPFLQPYPPGAAIGPDGRPIEGTRPVNPYAPYAPPSTAPHQRDPVRTAPPGFPIPLIPAIRPVTPPGSPHATPRPPSTPQQQPVTGRPASPRPSHNPTAQPSPGRSVTGTFSANPPSQDDPVMSCRFRDDPVSPAIRQDTIAINQKMDRLLGLLGDASIMAKLNTMDNKLGPQLNGGLSSVIKNFARSNAVQSFLNTLTFITALHNALQLSNNVRQTLFSAFDLIYQLPGMSQFAPTDPETGERVDYGTWASDQFDTLLRSAFGDQTVDTVRKSWNRASRIYQAGANIIFSMQSMMWSLMEAVEIVGNYVAKIGNALKKFGAVAEQAYGWMNPQAADSRKLTRVFNAINNTSEAVENIEQVAASAVDVTETASELTKQSQAFDRALRGVDEQGQPDPNLQVNFPYGDNRQPTNVQTAEGDAKGKAENRVEPIEPTDEQRQEPAE